eukprot:TRINITY_DN4404_c0_g1_i2.p1 TRINITY_DN4404_c0_g1~~TRINITY_DN4404_c0_g1_i2.p1  ORF type:complete len:999 (+),score=382.62 TRINITY_DN4404_c0_g1_i2:152-2998(+)
MGEEESVKVAVRMRLFNGREKSADATRIVRMHQEEQGSKTFITNPDTGEERHFSFDYSFQSHSADEPGIGEYATQDTVFNLLGKPVLYTALEGRNVCLFAYGQTGAGKSFSMLGKAEPKELAGIIPRSCLEIFRLRDQERDDPLIKYMVSIQVVEIYCEMVNDLLADRKTWPAQGHKPRLTKDGYVCDTVTRPCENYPDIESAFTFADKNRSVGSHALNPESSRAHTIYCINYCRQKKTSVDAKQAETITAKINLVDLAGSERSESAGTTGQMLKEGNAINLSLTALGGTIKALSEGKRPNFRDSKLTLLLQGSMTNGKVIMIAAVSPASICYDESMSTLRFAERIKMVKIKAKKNVTQDPVAEIKKEMEEMRKKMQEEIDMLKAATEGKELPKSEKAKELEELLNAQAEAERQLREDMEKQLANLSKTDEQRSAEREEIDHNWQEALGGAALQKADDVKEPHLRNLNEDPRLAETLVYPFKEGDNKIGRANKDDPPTIEFNGMGIIRNHCTVIWDKEGGTVTLSPAQGSSTYINGKRVGAPTPLVHNNRVWLGNNYAFRFVFPDKEDAGEKFETPPDYLHAAGEMAENSAVAGTDGLASHLSHQLSEALKKVEQANIVASDMSKDCRFQPKIVKNRITGEAAVVVHVTLPQGNLTWPWEKFNLRLTDMVRVWQQWQHAQDNELPFQEPPAEESPFSDAEDQLIGEADVWLQSLSNMIEHDSDTSILAPTGVSEGKLAIEINPLDKNGGEGPWEGDREELDPFVDKAQELLGQEIQFVVKIKKLVFDVDIKEGTGLPEYDHVWVRYKIDLNDEGEDWHRTECDPQCTLTPQFKYVQKHKRLVDDKFIRHLEKGRIVFQVWGKLGDRARKPNTQQGGGRNVRKRQQEVRQGILRDLGQALNVAKKGLPTLPAGWEAVAAYRDPDGKLHLNPPTGGSQPPAAADDEDIAD